MKVLLTASMIFFSLGAHAKGKNPLVDEFINDVGGNYATATIADTAIYVNESVARKAIEVCGRKGKTVSQIYNVNITLDADYLPTVRNGAVSQENPVWSFSARVTCN